NHRPLDTTFTLNGGDSKDVTGVPAGTTCVVAETGANNATSTKVAENPPSGAPDDGRVTLAAGTPVNVVYTNVFPGTGSQPAPPDNDLRAPSGGTGGTAGTTGGPATAAESPATAAPNPP